MCVENLYTCSKCDFTTRNDDPDCSKCGATYCMMAKTVSVCDEEEELKEKYEYLEEEYDRLREDSDEIAKDYAKLEEENYDLKEELKLQHRIFEGATQIGNDRIAELEKRIEELEKSL
jgi:uncharacterized protein YlxW (UPF0749 family)